MTTHKSFHFHLVALALATLLLLAVFVLYSAPSVGPASQEASTSVSTSTTSSSTNPNLGHGANILEIRKAKILSIAATGRPLTVLEREIFFQLLGGPQLAQYKFSQAEKIQIIKALNAGEKAPVPAIPVLIKITK